MIAIKGMKMPSSCTVCCFSTSSKCTINWNILSMFQYERPPQCPLRQVTTLRMDMKLRKGLGALYRKEIAAEKIGAALVENELISERKIEEDNPYYDTCVFETQAVVPSVTEKEPDGNRDQE